MKYAAPYGSADPNASYVDRNTAGAVKGSIPPAKAIENPQREIAAVIAAAGLAGSDEDLTQLLQAIRQLISEATGGGDTSNFVTMTAARARIPIYPEVLTADGKIPISSPATGTVRVPAGYDFLHRGIFNITTVQTDFVTVANKTYHLRWNPTDGLALKDLADVAYNPGAAVDVNEAFDSSYDDMLIAKVVTSAGNVATITELINKEHLYYKGVFVWTDNIIQTGSPGYGASRSGNTATYNFARRPSHMTPVAVLGAGAAGVSVGLDGLANLIRSLTWNRYSVTFDIYSDFGGVVSGLSVEATIIASA